MLYPNKTWQNNAPLNIATALSLGNMKNKCCLCDPVQVYTKNVPNAIDIREDLQRGTGNVSLVIEQAQIMYNLGKEIEQLEDLLKSKEEEYRRLSCDTLPTLMESEGVDHVGLKNGFQLVLDPAFRASLPAESTIDKADEEDRPMLEKRRMDGLEWLKDNQASSVIKTEIKVKLSTGQIKLANEVLKTLRNFSWKVKGKLEKVRLDIDQKENVHPGTLSKLLKEKRDNGVDIPLDTFAVFDGKEAKIKPPKKGKGE